MGGVLPRPLASKERLAFTKFSMFSSKTDADTLVELTITSKTKTHNILLLVTIET